MYYKGVSELEIMEEAVYEDFALVELGVGIGNDFVTVQGKARRHPTDKPDLELAELLAYARAFDSLAKRLFRRAEGKIKHNDDMRAMRKQHKLPKTVEKQHMAKHCWCGMP